MDDFSQTTLYESRIEWSARLVNLLTPIIIDGFKYMLIESFDLCKKNNEEEKYLKTFQNCILSIPQWNATTISKQSDIIVTKSKCNYLEDLISCVHIIHLKSLTAMRVGQSPKKININIPVLNDFIHKVYINVSRQAYKNVFLFERKIPPLQIQKNNREFEIIVQGCILNTIRDNIPVDEILKAYLSETTEEEVVECIKEEVLPEPTVAQVGGAPVVAPVASVAAVGSAPASTTISFNNTDYVQTTDGKVIEVSAPKTIERLDEISKNKKSLDDCSDDSDSDSDSGMEKLQISNESLNINDLLTAPTASSSSSTFPDIDVILDDIEFLK